MLGAGDRSDLAVRHNLLTPKTIPMTRAPRRRPPISVKCRERFFKSSHMTKAARHITEGTTTAPAGWVGIASNTTHRVARDAQCLAGATMARGTRCRVPARCAAMLVLAGTQANPTWRMRIAHLPAGIGGGNPAILVAALTRRLGVAGRAQARLRVRFLSMSSGKSGPVHSGPIGVVEG